MPCWAECREDSRCREVQSHDATEMTQGQDDQQGSTNNNSTDNDEEYWRPSYMFHWLSATGEEVTNAYEAFKSYEGKKSYTMLNLKAPTPMEQDDGHTDEWSHMSDYDETGFALM